MKDDRLYLYHIKECIERIEQYTKVGKQAYLKDSMSQDAVLRNLHTLSESTQRLSSELKSKHSDIDWRGIIGFRNVLVHDYLGINHIRIWEIIEKNLPDLKSQIQSILQDLGE